MAVDTGALTSWLSANWLTLLVVTVAAFLLFRFANPLVHRLVERAVRSSVDPSMDPATAEDETHKRVDTIEDLLARVIRGAVLLSLLFVVLAVFDLLPVIAGLGVVLAAITLAGQSIVLDYLMGALILVEGQYYRGDWVAVGAVQGEVEEVGLRRTVVRDSTGTVHSISNGEIRISSNFTRIYAGLVIEVPVAPGTDVDRAGAVMDAVGVAMAADPAWSERVLQAPTFRGVTAVTDTGLTLRAVGRVRPADRFAAPGEFRRRLLVAFGDAGIETAMRGRFVVAPSEAVPTAPSAPTPAAPTPAAPTPPADDPGRPVDDGA